MAASRSSPYGHRWRQLSKAYLLSHPLCQMCRDQGHAVPATEVDHILPHRLRQALESGDPHQIARARLLFYDQKNWMGLCESHHAATKQRIERRGYEIGATEDGMPLDPDHPWNL